MKAGVLSTTMFVIWAFFAFFGCASRQVSDLPDQPQAASIEHTVQLKGETLGAIAAWYTGDAAGWGAIAQANPNQDPELLELGDKIVVPRELVIREDPMPASFLESFSLKRRREREIIQKSKSKDREGGVPLIDQRPTLVESAPRREELLNELLKQ